MDYPNQFIPIQYHAETLSKGMSSNRILRQFLPTADLLFRALPCRQAPSPPLCDLDCTFQPRYRSHYQLSLPLNAENVDENSLISCTWNGRKNNLSIYLSTVDGEYYLITFWIWFLNPTKYRNHWTIHGTLQFIMRPNALLFQIFKRCSYSVRGMSPVLIVVLRRWLNPRISICTKNQPWRIIRSGVSSWWCVLSQRHSGDACYWTDVKFSQLHRANLFPMVLRVWLGTTIPILESKSISIVNICIYTPSYEE